MLRRLSYSGFWKGFDAHTFFLHWYFHQASIAKRIRVVGPFLNMYEEFRLRSAALFGDRAEFFVTGENTPPRFDIATRQIGFWRTFPLDPRVLRFPNWMWHLDWPGVENQPQYPRYGARLSIERLLEPIEKNHGDVDRRKSKAVMFASHLGEARSRLLQAVESVIGCDGYGAAFGNYYRGPKMAVLDRYALCFCPENSIGDGYVTEKIPEAFHAGCVPLTWCRPEDLQEDFNPDAVVNLYGLSDTEICLLLDRVKNDSRFLKEKRSVPLLKNIPSLSPLRDFILG